MTLAETQIDALESALSSLAVLVFAWDEGSHVRDAHGRFTSGGGSDAPVIPGTGRGHTTADLIAKLDASEHPTKMILDQARRSREAADFERRDLTLIHDRYVAQAMRADNHETKMTALVHIGFIIAGIVAHAAFAAVTLPVAIGVAAIGAQFDTSALADAFSPLGTEITDFVRRNV